MARKSAAALLDKPASRGLPEIPEELPITAAKPAKNGKAAATTGPAIYVPKQQVRQKGLAIVSSSPLISHKMDQKVVQMILGKHMNFPAEPRKAKNPVADFLACIHRLPNGQPGMPGGALKAAMVSACRQLPKIKMVAVKQFFHVIPNLIQVYGDEARMCQHVVKNDNGVIDIRFRAMFMRWSMIVPIRYDEELITMEMLATLIGRAGFGVGIGDWRPGAPESFNGQAGCWTVAGPDDLVGPDHSAWCKKNPVHEAELDMWGVVPASLVALYERVAALPPPPEDDGGEPRKGKRSKTAPADPEDAQELYAAIRQHADHSHPPVYDEKTDTIQIRKPAKDGRKKPELV